MLELESIRFDDEGAAEMDGNRRLVFVPRAEIVSIEAAYGTGSERPVVAIILGVVLLLIALTPVVMLVNLFRVGGTYEIKFLTAVAFAIPGLWLLDLGLRRRSFVRVVTRHGVRKLLVPRTVAREAVEAFVARARSHFHYP